MRTMQLVEQQLLNATTFFTGLSDQKLGMKRFQCLLNSCFTNTRLFAWMCLDGNCNRNGIVTEAALSDSEAPLTQVSAIANE